MRLEKEIDGLLYSLDTDEQEATVKKCVDKERTGEVVIPESFFHEGIVYRVTSIGEWAFRDCTCLTCITIPESVTSIGRYAFYECSSLTSIIIPKSVTNIGDCAFSRCSSLTAITIPEGVTSIGKWAFSRCSSLGDISVDERNTIYDSREGCNAVIETNSNTLVVGCAKTVIPENVTSIGNSAFSGRHSLTSIKIPQSVTSIGNGAFSGCSSLTSITIPEGVTSIGDDAFRSCSSLTSILIPEGVTSIGNYAFDDCSSLTSITIPEGVTSIGEWTFDDCRSLTSALISKSVTSIRWYAFSGCSKLTSILIPRNVKHIWPTAFKNSGITYLTILGKPFIGEEAFVRCRKLTDVYCYSEEVPPTNNNAFGNLDLSPITLHVPKNAMEQYKNTEPWSEFGTIVAIK